MVNRQSVEADIEAVFMSETLTPLKARDHSTGWIRLPGARRPWALALTPHLPPPSYGGGRVGERPQQDCRQLADHDLKSEASAASPAPSRPPPYDGRGERAAKFAPLRAGHE